MIKTSFRDLHGSSIISKISHDFPDQPPTSEHLILKSENLNKTQKNLLDLENFLKKMHKIATPITKTMRR